MLQSMELQRVGRDLAIEQQQFLQECCVYLGGREEAGCSFFIPSFFGHWSHSWNLVPQLDMDISLIRMKVKATQSCMTLRDPMDYTVHEILHGLSWSPWNTGVSSSLSLLQGIFPIQVAGGFFTSWATREAQVDQDVLKHESNTTYCTLLKILWLCQLLPVEYILAGYMDFNHLGKILTLLSLVWSSRKL